MATVPYCHVATSATYFLEILKLYLGSVNGTLIVSYRV